MTAAMGIIVVLVNNMKINKLHIAQSACEVRRYNVSRHAKTKFLFDFTVHTEPDSFYKSNNYGNVSKFSLIDLSVIELNYRLFTFITNYLDLCKTIIRKSRSLVNVYILIRTANLIILLMDRFT